MNSQFTKNLMMKKPFKEITNLIHIREVSIKTIGEHESQSVCRSVVSNSLQPHGLLVQAPLSMGFSRQEYWSGLPFPSPGDLPNLGIKPRSPALQADSLLSEPPVKPTRKCNLILFILAKFEALLTS